MTREHIGIAIALRIPIVIVVTFNHHIYIGRDRSKTRTWLGCFFWLTKKDITPQNVYDANMLNICKILKSNAVRRLPVLLIKHQRHVVILQKPRVGVRAFFFPGKARRWNKKKRPKIILDCDSFDQSITTDVYLRC